MRFPRWAVPVVLRLLSLAGLTSAGGDKASMMVGFALSSSAASFPTPTLSQPPLSLELDFLVQIADHEFKVPIMPLHLLGKKSWNVYNHDNIERVKRDEAAAKAKEEAEEQRMQELDAERRIQVLRGEIPTPLLAIEETPKNEKRGRDESGSNLREHKRRKKAGENDTDFEMRVAHEQTLDPNKDRQILLRKDSDAPITDHSGHISLFPAPSSKQPFTAEKNAEAGKEAARKKREYEDQYTMRFSNAAGLKQSLDKPWYSKPTSGKEIVPEGEIDMPGKDVWGNEDPRRREREAKRVVESDPLAMMRQGAAQVRQVERERKKWREEKEREMRELEEAELKRKRRKRRYEEDNEDDLENFRLDDDKSSSRRRERNDSEREHRRRHKHSRRNEHRDEERRHRHRHSHRHDD